MAQNNRVEDAIPLKIAEHNIREDRHEAVNGIRRGLEQMERGEGRPAKQVFDEMRRNLNKMRG